MESVEAFKSAVIRIRDILRGPGVGITGMDSMRHICLYLLSRYMTCDRVGAVGIPEDFAWETLIGIVQTKNGGLQKALDSFYHPEVDCLVRHFDRLFGTDKFPFDIKSPQKHKEILEILDKINMDRVDCQMDVLGWVYEQHLRTGSSSASRDLGQFFTDRSICNYMTGLCKPGFKGPGIPESVCDPSMGTGGFLTAFVKYYKTQYPDIAVDWAVQQKEIHGCDTDPKVAGVARLNLFMETGGHRSTNLLTHDSLYGGLTQTGYDVILANMPFGIKDIKHADCCEIIKALKIRGTKSEPLFLQLMMTSLNPGGRCAVVVPDGMLVNNSKLHNETRRYLLDNLELRRVVKLKGKFFMNTGIQPSILFFEKTGKNTTEVEFWELVRDDKGNNIETMLLSIPRSSLNAACTLDMRRYVIQEAPLANPASYPLLTLAELVDYTNGKSLDKKDRAENGAYGIMGGGIGYYGRTNRYNRDGETISVSKSGTAGFVAYHHGRYWASDCFTIVPKDTGACMTRYLYYYLRLMNSLASYNTGSTIPHCKWEDIMDVRVCVPPMDVQREIVETLDRLFQPGTTLLADNLKRTVQALTPQQEQMAEAMALARRSVQMVGDVRAQMVADIKVQMRMIIRCIQRRSNEYETKTIGDMYVSPRNIKKFSSKEMDNHGDSPFYNGKYNSPVGLHSEHSYDSDTPYFVMIKDGGGDHTSDAVGMGKFFDVVGKSTITSHNLILVQKTEDALRHRYVHHYIAMNIKELRDKAKYSINLGSISIKDILGFPIVLPPTDVQHDVVKRLDAMQAQVDALEAMQQRADDNARFILESYIH